MDYIADKYCDSENTYVEICYNIIFMIAGPDSEELNEVSNKWLRKRGYERLEKGGEPKNEGRVVTGGLIQCISPENMMPFYRSCGDGETWSWNYFVPVATTFIIDVSNYLLSDMDIWRFTGGKRRR